MLELYLRQKKNTTIIRKELRLKSTKVVSDILKSYGYHVGGRITVEKAISNKNAVDYYIQNINNHPNLSEICKQFNVDRHTISRHVKFAGYPIIDFQHTSRFDNTVFDIIDTEEKAYWLGFIFADGYIAYNPTNNKSKYRFELSLKGDDYLHLYKFNTFTKHINQNTVLSTVNCNGKVCSRCRWGITNEHFYKSLYSLGCVPNKSLILKFPDVKLFKSKDLVRHFLRGYFDGDGCISWRDKEHKNICISVLGTFEFLTEFMLNVPPYKIYSLTNNSRKSNITKTFSKKGKTAFKVLKYLYSNATIYLDRKYQRFLEACRLYEQS